MKGSEKVAWDTDPRTNEKDSDTDDVFAKPPQTMLLDDDLSDQVGL